MSKEFGRRNNTMTINNARACAPYAFFFVLSYYFFVNFKTLPRRVTDDDPTTLGNERITAFRFSGRTRYRTTFSRIPSVSQEAIQWFYDDSVFFSFTKFLPDRMVHRFLRDRFF